MRTTFISFSPNDIVRPIFLISTIDTKKPDAYIIFIVFANGSNSQSSSGHQGRI
jgi:hypothetical protein